jgi:hypothetical protein
MVPQATLQELVVTALANMVKLTVPPVDTAATLVVLVELAADMVITTPDTPLVPQVSMQRPFREKLGALGGEICHTATMRMVTYPKPLPKTFPMRCPTLPFRMTNILQVTAPTMHTASPL